MSSLEGNKIAAAVLVGGMITLSVGIATDFIYQPHHGAQAAQEGGAAATPKKAAPVEPVLGLIASADAANGQKVAAKCQSCHDFTSANTNKVGPGLYGLIGRPAGAHEGFSYSDAIKAHAQPWSYAELNRYLANPKGYIPGTKMAFPGLPKVQDRADLMAWLRDQAPSPAPLPTPDEIAAEQAAFAGEQEGGAAEAAPAAEAAAPAAESAPAATATEGATQSAAAEPTGGASALALIATADPAVGEKASAKCKACHDFTQGGKNKVGPHLWGIVGASHASVSDFPYSDALKGMAGKPWTYEELDKYLENPKAYAPGTKMSFPGLKKPEERAAMIRWLRDQSDAPIPLPQ